MLDVTFDHLAVAVPSIHDVWPRYAAELGATWLGGEAADGFRLERFAFVDGTRLELLEPSSRGSDFLRRFMARSGPGPHHLTFKVDGLDRAVEAVTAAGIAPTSVQTDDPGWKELFVHPKDAVGIVVQLAESTSPPWAMPAPPGLPGPLGAPAAVRRLVHLVRSLPAALAFFQELLQGEVIVEGETPDERFAEVCWDTGPPVRFVQPLDQNSVLADRLGELPGRFDHVELSVPDLQVVSSAVADEAGTAWVDPTANRGLRLRLIPSTAADALEGTV